MFTVFNMGWGCVVCGLVCSKSSGFSSGLLFSVGFFGLRFPLCVCVCARARARARGLVHLVFLQESKNTLTNMKECREGKPIWGVSLFIR